MTKSRYAIRALLELAQRPRGEVTSLSIIAKRQRINPKYLEQILFRLRQARLINGKKGPGGGFVLARDPKEITLKDILDAVGETTAPLQCLLGKADKYCSHVTPCPMQDCWFKLKKEMDSFFNKHTLHDICSRTKRREI
jgi:Rrf2 family iron-sulfur cluster assembly transcriptional regulator